MAMKQRHIQRFFQGLNLPRYRGLAQVQRITRMGEGPRLRDRVKDTKLVPIRWHQAAAAWPASWAARYFSASSAAMQPVPAAVTAWR